VFIGHTSIFRICAAASRRAAGSRPFTTNLTLNYLSRYRKRWRLFSEMRSNTQDSEDDGAELDWEVPDTVLADLSAEQRSAIVDAALRQLPTTSGCRSRSTTLRTCPTKKLPTS